jgi:diguanylate cyclase (GGDEF)-like protein
MLDLDMFKSVNDSLGHQAGDILLAQVADRIKSTVREVDVACRLGGDEFAVIVLPGEGDFADGCALLAQRLIETIAAPVEIDGQSVVVGCSIGVALVPEHGRRINEVLRNADLALYKAKNDGRSCFRIYSERMIWDAERRHILEIDLRAAIWDDRLELHYQPVFDLQTGRVVSVEALARWNHKTKGMISPSEFIPVAEEAGLISDLANLLLVKACQDATRMPDDVTVAFNLSPVQFAKSDVIDATVFALADSGLPEGRLEFEITEGVLMKETERNIAALRALKNIGVSIALDDFGVGFSSLSYLTAFPFDKVKIDKSFIDKLDRPETVAVVDAIVRLAGSLQLAVVAEGIETEDQLARVRPLGIRLGQGFLFSTAVPFDRLSFAPIDIASAPRPLRRKAG